MKRSLLIAVLLFIMLMTEGCTVLSENKAEELYQAIIAEDTEKVRMLAKDHQLINRPRTLNPLLMLSDSENIYPLEAACATSAELTEILLEEGADVNVIDPYIRSTPLINALFSYYPDRFRIAFLLIEKGADIDVVDNNHRTALNACVAPSSRDTDSAREEQKRLLEYLLEHCDLETVTDKSGSNPLIEAAKYDDGPLVDYIAGSCYFPIDDMPGGYTALMAAAGMGSAGACGVLLNYGADPLLKSYKGKTAADYAEEKGNLDIAEILDHAR